jgi:hypothetical protein
MSHSGRGYTAAYWLKKDNTFWASGGNWYSQLGVIDSPGTNNIIALRIPLPTGEYPVQFKWLGGYYATVGGSNNNLIGGGALMVSNKNKLYTWGKPYVSASSVKNVDTLRFPHCIVDFYDPQNI